MTSTEFEFPCARCGGPIAGERQWIGQEVTCPHCNQTTLVSGDPDPARPAPAPPAPTPRVASAASQAAPRRGLHPLILIAVPIIIALCVAAWMFVSQPDAKELVGAWQARSGAPNAATLYIEKNRTFNFDASNGKTAIALVGKWRVKFPSRLVLSIEQGGEDIGNAKELVWKIKEATPAKLRVKMDQGEETFTRAR